MNRMFATVVAAMALTLVSVGTAAAQDEMCTSPEEPTEYFCRLLSVTLVPDADIEEVLNRLLPGAVVDEKWGERSWTVLLAEGDDAVAAREVLLADASVEEVGLHVRGELTGGDGTGDGAVLPDTALSGAGTSSLAHLGTVMLALGAGAGLALRTARR